MVFSQMTAETLLTFFLIIFVLLLILIGIYCLILLIELKQAVHRTNQVLSKTESLLNFFEERLLRPTAAFGGYLALAKEFFRLLQSVRANLKKGKESTDDG